MTQFTEHIKEKFYNRAVKVAKEVMGYYDNDPEFSFTAKLDFTAKVLEIAHSYMNGVRDTLDSMSIHTISYMELSTELTNIIDFLANNLYEQLKESK